MCVVSSIFLLIIFFLAGIVISMFFFFPFFAIISTPSFIFAGKTLISNSFFCGFFAGKIGILISFTLASFAVILVSL